MIFSRRKLSTLSYCFNYMVVAATCISLAGCGKEKKSRNISEIPRRNGAPLEIYSRKFYDGSVSFGASGTLLALVSGKAGTDLSGRQAFAGPWPRGASGFDALTTLGTNNEIQTAKISPDGTWVAAIGTTGGTTDVWLVDRSDANKATNITNSAAKEASLSWSPDSKYLSFTSASDSKVWVVEVATGGARGNLTTKGFDLTGAKAVTFAAVGAGYRLAALSVDPTSLTSSVFAANSAQPATTLAFEAVAQDVQAIDGPFVAAGTWLLLGVRAPTQTITQVVGRYEVPAEQVKPSRQVLTQLMQINLETKEVLRTLPQGATQIVAAAADISGTPALVVSRVTYRCANDGPDRIGNVVARLTPGSTDLPLLIFRVRNDLLELTDALCAPEQKAPAEGETPPPVAAYVLDQRIEELAISKTSGGNYLVALASRQSAARTEDCSNKVADAEIRIAEFDANNALVSNSYLLEPQNRAPVTDQAAESCPK